MPNKSSKPKIEIYDTTLRDGSQGEGISFSVQDKLRITEKLDWFGVDFIEGGWPGSNPKDLEFFKEAKKLKLKHAKLAAFGSTRRAGIKASDDANLNFLIESGTEVITIFGKSWDLHVTKVFGVSLEENLKMIDDSVRYLRSKKKRVVYDAEHFFDGYKANPAYALKAIGAAAAAGAETIVLCDTNGGTMPSEVAQIVKAVAKKVRAPLGIHTHNDCAMAVANAIAAVESGARHAQGTINGFGERCGNADLLSIAANLQLKYGYQCVPDIRKLTELSRFVGEVGNLVLQNNQPYVGKSAFAHKGGVHINAVMKHPVTYEHVRPEEVGNERRFLTSEMMGKTHVMLKAKSWQIDLAKDNPKTGEILKEIQKLENEGYQFEAAEASFELVVRRVMAGKHKFFEFGKVEVLAENLADGNPVARAQVTATVNGKSASGDATGDGPVNALDKALRKALIGFYPALADMHLSDFKVRVLDQKAGTAAKVRVFIESRDEKRVWTTVGISENIIEASWKALVDSIEYKLLKDGVGK